MGFPPDVSERALLDSGRHCCLCHKFCGTHIELHHIVAKADGGKDTYENCVPLCFDCHALVRHYDPRHPKGKRFTETELIGHRERWYQRISEPREAPGHKREGMVTWRQLLDEGPEFEIFKKIKTGQLIPVNKFTGWQIPCRPDFHEYLSTNSQETNDLNRKIVEIGVVELWLERRGSLDQLSLHIRSWDLESQKRLGDIIGGTIQKYIPAQHKTEHPLRERAEGTRKLNPDPAAEELDALTMMHNAHRQALESIGYLYRISWESAPIDAMSRALKSWKMEVETHLETEWNNYNAYHSGILSDDTKREKWKYLLLPQDREAADRLKEYLADSIFEVS